MILPTRGSSSKIRGLYVIVDPGTTKTRSVQEIALLALEGGASIIQLRYKSGDKVIVLEVAHEIKQMCQAYKALFIMNDDPNLALQSSADGLHLGVEDLPVAQARKILSPNQIVGTSNNTMAEVKKSIRSGADYLAVGTIFPTKTMGKKDRPVVGLHMIRKVKEKTKCPVVAIGGIKPDNVARVVEAGADCICVVSEITLADSPRDAAINFVDLISKASS